MISYHNYNVDKDLGMLLDIDTVQGRSVCDFVFQIQCTNRTHLHVQDTTVKIVCSCNDPCLLYSDDCLAGYGNVLEREGILSTK